MLPHAVGGIHHWYHRGSTAVVPEGNGASTHAANTSPGKVWVPLVRVGAFIDSDFLDFVRLVSSFFVADERVHMSFFVRGNFTTSFSCAIGDIIADFCTRSCKGAVVDLA